MSSFNSVILLTWQSLISLFCFVFFFMFSNVLGIMQNSNLIYRYTLLCTLLISGASISIFLQITAACHQLLTKHTVLYRFWEGCKRLGLKGQGVCAAGLVWKKTLNVTFTWLHLFFPECAKLISIFVNNIGRRGTNRWQWGVYDKLKVNEGRSWWIEERFKLWTWCKSRNTKPHKTPQLSGENLTQPSGNLVNNY